MKNITLNGTELLMLNNLAHGMNMRKFAKKQIFQNIKFINFQKI